MVNVYFKSVFKATSKPEEDTLMMQGHQVGEVAHLEVIGIRALNKLIDFSYSSCNLNEVFSKVLS